ncbi:thymidine kinase [Brazilian marseillevirus]|uniref:thymidine kinase n=1 Tax=Brazilian marseillevirus TaxID=1813599 RepID=UPI0007821987|nr:thymidine kinase [Brazilian marseillevirus]AMQ10789.1 thymidine kinase [Brazilian marseillevirus]
MDGNNSLEMIYGPMRSGKTTELRKRLGIFASLGFRVTCANSTRDTRSDKGFSTHNKELIEDCQSIFPQKVDEIKDILTEGFDVVGIDEAQFFLEETLVADVMKIVDSGKVVIMSGLDGDSEQKKMGKYLDLIPKADSAEKFLAWCFFCAQEKKMVKAPFSKRLSEEKQQVLVGNMYASVCRSCLKK